MAMSRRADATTSTSLIDDYENVPRLPARAELSGQAQEPGAEPTLDEARVNRERDARD